MKRVFVGLKGYNQAFSKVDGNRKRQKGQDLKEKLLGGSRQQTLRKEVPGLKRECVMVSRMR